jgi:hypothetical protein
MLVSYAPALPLGMEGKAECFEFKSSFDFDEKAFVDHINKYTGSGIRVVRIRKLPEKELPLNSRIKQMVYSVNLNMREVKEALAAKKKEKGCIHREELEFLEAELAALVGSQSATEMEFLVDRKKRKLFLCLPSLPQRGLRAQDIISAVLGLVHPVYALTREKFIFTESEGN